MPNNNKSQEKSLCSTMNMPLPETVLCPYCDSETEIWTDEQDAVCPSCKKSLKYPG